MSDHVALYLRVSTVDQDLAGQERDLREYCARKGWTIGCVFAEKTSASGKVQRDAWEELRKEACLPTTRRFGHVLVWALDRWSREPSFVRAVGSIEELEQLGIRWHSLKEPILDSGEDGAANLARDILRGVLPTIASFEARRRSERTQVAMREIKEGRRETRSGRPPGRPRRVTPELVAEAARLRAIELGWSEIAQRTGFKAQTARRAVLRAKKGGDIRAKPPSAQKGRRSERTR